MQGEIRSSQDITQEVLEDFVKWASVAELKGLQGLCANEIATRKSRLMKELNELGGFAPPPKAARSARAPRSDKGKPRLRVEPVPDEVTPEGVPDDVGLI